MRGRKFAIWAVFTYASLITAGIIPGCGEDEEPPYDPAGLYSITYNYTSGDYFLERINSNWTIDGNGQIEDDGLKGASIEIFDSVIVGSIKDCDSELCQFELSYKDTKETDLGDLTIEMVGSGNIDSSGEVQGSCTIEIYYYNLFIRTDLYTFNSSISGNKQ